MMAERRPDFDTIERKAANPAIPPGVGNDTEATTGTPGLRSRFPAPVRFLFLTALSVFLAEMVTMLLLARLEPLSRITEAVLDSLVLIILISPALYLFLFRPMKREITRRRKAQADLRVMNTMLEQRVAERTADLTAANEGLARMTSELTQAEEQERRRVAAGLHDLMGESMITARLRLGMLKTALPEQQSRQIEQVREQLQSVIQSVRALSFQISNPLLYEVGLEAALESLLGRLAEDQQLRAEFDSQGARLSLPDSLKVILYRVVSELLVNVVKHAEAQTVRLTIRNRDDRLTIAVEDDGIGFVPQDADSWSRRTAGLGLFKARERIAGLGGELTVASAPGRGTRIEIGAPVGNRPDQSLSPAKSVSD